MKTDHPINLFLSAGTEAFRVLTGGRELVGPYRFCSLTIKGLERRLDGIFEPDGHAGPVYVVEFQGQHSEKAWYNLLTKIGLYGEEHRLDAPRRRSDRYRPEIALQRRASVWAC